MSLSVQVWTLPGEKLESCTHQGVEELIQLARREGMPMLGNVDSYDDTRFNRAQMKLVASELNTLAGIVSGGALDCVGELLSMVERVRERPHRYLVFVGD